MWYAYQIADAMNPNDDDVLIPAGASINVLSAGVDKCVVQYRGDIFEVPTLVIAFFDAPLKCEV